MLQLLAHLSAIVCREKAASDWHEFFKHVPSQITDPWHKGSHPEHRLNMYAELANSTGARPDKYLGSGMEAVVARTADNNALKFSYNPNITRAPRAGLDIPTISTHAHEMGAAAGNPVYAVKQPVAQVSDSFWDNLKGNVEMRNKAKAMGLNPVDLMLGFKQTGMVNKDGVPTRVLLDRGAVLDSPRSQAPLLSRMGHSVRETAEDALLAGYNRPNLLRAMGAAPLAAYLAKKYSKNETPDAQTTAGLGLLGAAPWAVRGVDIKGILPVPVLPGSRLNVRGGLPAAGLAGLGSLMLLLRKGQQAKDQAARTNGVSNHAI